eukprot:Nitzschia sp. Nitz4//scaffold137_size62074//1976//2383//NITZ4_006402-RA/size62074-snap-gene-0.13-mRNA-1//1//CDS//3329535661//5822//frame0
MIFRVASIARARAGVTARHFSSVPATGGGPLGALARGWYNVFGVSTARYAAFLAIGCIVAEFGTNAVTDALWEMNNRGKTYSQVDWSKFDPVDEEEEDEDDDDDE